MSESRDRRKTGSRISWWLADAGGCTALARGLLDRNLQLAVQKDIVTAPAGKSALRVWHLSPDAPKVDIYVNGKKTLSKVPYKAASNYLTLAPGKYTIAVKVAGTKATVWSGKVKTRAGRAYSATALGAVKAPDRSSASRCFTTPDLNHRSSSSRRGAARRRPSFPLPSRALVQSGTSVSRSACAT